MHVLLNCAVVGCGGFVGSVLRYLITLVPFASGLPIATLTANLFGSFLLGGIVAFVEIAGIDEKAMLFLRVGLCGGFTTFSTFAVENAGMLVEGSWALSAAYMIASVVLCVGGIFVAQALVKLALT